MSEAQPETARRPRKKEWLVKAVNEAAAAAGMSVGVHTNAVKVYCRRTGLPRPTPSNLSDSVVPAVEAVRVALEGWDGKSDVIPDPLHPGAVWVTSRLRNRRYLKVYVGADRHDQRG